MFSLIWAIIIGFIVGLIARFIHPGKDKAGFVITTVLGVAGSLVATYGGRGLGWYNEGEAAGFLASIVGAVVIMVVYNFLKKE